MKRIIALLLGIAMALALSVPAFASDGADAPIPDGLKAYVLTFIDSVDSGHRDVLSVVPMYDYTRTAITGYYVTFQQDGEPAGYMVLSLFDAEDPIIEFATEGSGIVPTTYGHTNDVLVFEGGGRMYAAQRDGTYYDIMFDTVVDEATVQATALSTEPMPLINLNDAFMGQPGSITVSKMIKSLANVARFPNQQDYANPQSSSDVSGCGPNTVANILLYWHVDRGMTSIGTKIPATATSMFQKGKYLYDTAYTAMGTTASKGTYLSDMPKGYAAILGTQNVNWRMTSTATEAPSAQNWTQYQAMLDNNVPIQLYMVAGPVEYLAAKHFAFTYGYVKTSHGASYLMALDGTNKLTRYIKFLNNVPLMQATGIEVLR